MNNYKLMKIRNHVPDNSLKDVKEICQHELKKLSGIFKTGESIAIAVGSRGVDNLETVVCETVHFIKSYGGKPFIVPAMGSHGGATAAGQEEVLKGYGITEKNTGAPVYSSMDVVNIIGGRAAPVYIDKLAWQSDGIILINKVKPHTDFHGTYESGLVKMAVIGLGKDIGARTIHNSGVYGLKEMIPFSAKIIFDTGKIRAGMALIENSYDKTMLLKAIHGNDIMAEELKLIEIARQNRPSLPVTDIDVLIIDRIGKNISGVGMDTNITGRIRIYGQPEPAIPAIKSITVHDLTDESHGNATGVGLADVITQKLFRKINFGKTYKNTAISSFLERGKIPFVAENDLEAVELALRNCGYPVKGEERIIRIKNTLRINDLYVSKGIYHEIKSDKRIELLQEETDIFDSDQNLLPF